MDSQERRHDPQQPLDPAPGGGETLASASPGCAPGARRRLPAAFPASARLELACASLRTQFGLPPALSLVARPISEPGIANSSATPAPTPTSEASPRTRMDRLGKTGQVGRSLGRP